MESAPIIVVATPPPQKEKFPVGMIVVLVLTGWSFLATLLALMEPATQFGPIILTGLIAFLYSLVVLAVLGLSFYGVLKRKIWARKLIIGWYLIATGILTLNFVSFLADKQSIVRLYQEMLPADAQFFTEATVTGFLAYTLIAGVLVAIIVIFYVHRKRDFFKN